MFELVSFTDEVILQPSELTNFNKSIEISLGQRILNKVIPDQGYCISIKQIKILDKIVIQGEGTVQIKLEYDAVLFRPQIDEILIAKVIHQNERGLYAMIAEVTVFIPSENLMKPSFYHYHEKKWIWKFEVYDLFYEDKQMIKLRVKNANFNKEVQAKHLLLREQFTHPQQQSLVEETNLDLEDTSIYFNHFVIGSCDEDGLGMLSWWNQQQTEL